MNKSIKKPDFPTSVKLAEGSGSGLKMESLKRILIGINTMPIHNNAKIITDSFVVSVNMLKGEKMKKKLK